MYLIKNILITFVICYLNKSSASTDSLNSPNNKNVKQQSSKVSTKNSKQLSSSSSFTPLHKSSIYQKQSSFPLLSLKSVSPFPVSTTTSTIKATPTWSLHSLANIYIALTVTAEPVLAFSSMGLYSQIENMKNLSDISQLNTIPALLNWYSLVYSNLAQTFTVSVQSLLGVKQKPVGLLMYLLSKPSFTQDFMKAIQAGSKSLGNVATSLSKMDTEIVSQLAALNVTSTQSFLDLESYQLNTIQQNIQKVINYNQAIETAFQNMAASIAKLLNLQTALPGKYLVISKSNWLSSISAVFKKIGLTIVTFQNDFNNKIVQQSFFSSTINITQLNHQNRKTSNRLAYLIRVLGDYFKLFNINCKEVLQYLTLEK